MQNAPRTHQLEHDLGGHLCQQRRGAKRQVGGQPVEFIQLCTRKGRCAAIGGRSVLRHGIFQQDWGRVTVRMERRPLSHPVMDASSGGVNNLPLHRRFWFTSFFVMK